MFLFNWNGYIGNWKFFGKKMKNNLKKILIVAPHPDDETLGCGGTILKHKSLGDEVHWLICTKMFENSTYKLNQIKIREKEISSVYKHYKFDSLLNLSYEAASLNQTMIKNIVEKLNKILINLKPDVIYLPFFGDAHSDHRILTEAVLASSKTFRAPFIKKILAYETLSETNFSIPNSIFKPNVYIDISRFFNTKLEILELYKSEIKNHPFPRSKKAVEALALLRGSESDLHYAEAFMLIKSIE